MNVSPSTVFVKKHGVPILGRRMEQWSNTSDVDYRATWKSSLFSQVKESLPFRHFNGQG